MPNKFLLAGAISLVGTLALSSAAIAGDCGGASGPNCNAPVNFMGGPAPVFDAVTIRNTPPGGHYRSINFQRSPNVSITRVHGMLPGAGLTDAPSEFTKGCHPQSTSYCRQEAGVPVDVELSSPPTPHFQSAPVIATPPVAPRVWTGQGYDASKFAPRQYGDNTFTPGTAYIPTSHVNRNPADADRMLNSGRAVPQPIANGGVAPRPHMVMGPVHGGFHPAPRMASTTVMAAGPHGTTYGLPAHAAPRPVFHHGSRGSYGPVPPAMLSGPAVRYGATPQTILQETPVPMAAQHPRQVNGNTYVSNIAGDGTYWEKTSGMTRFGDTIATQVICKRKLPQQVVNPHVPVPYPVPTPLPTACQAPAPHAGHHQAGPRQMPRNPGPWVY